jgi:hypothetical protein
MKVDEIERVAARRIHWASIALAASARELHEVDAQRAEAFAAEAERVASLSKAGDPRIERWGTWTPT